MKKAQIYGWVTYASLVMVGVAFILERKTDALAFFALAVAFSAHERMALQEQRKGEK